MSSPQRARGGDLVAEDGSRIAAAQGPAALQEALEALEARVARLEEAIAQRDAANRQLGRDVIAMGKGLSDRIRMLDARLTAASMGVGRPSGPPARRGGPFAASPLTLVVLGGLAAAAVIGALWYGSGQGGPWPPAVKATGSDATPIIVVDDAIRTRPAGGPARPAATGEGATAHVLYGASSSPGPAAPSSSPH